MEGNFNIKKAITCLMSTEVKTDKQSFPDTFSTEKLSLQIVFVSGFHRADYML